MWGPCFSHKRVIFWPFLGLVDYGIHPELWKLAWSIPGHIEYDSGTLNSKDHVRTMFWPYKGHILAISRKSGLMDTPRNMKFGMDHPWEHWLLFRKKKFEGPYEDHVLAMKGPHFCHFYKRGLQDTPSNVIFDMDNPWAHWLRFRSKQFEGRCEDHVLAMKGPYFCHF